ncbi:MAG: HD domain-containing protein [Lachnospiraceae bacterium]|nr:HD domain-containing protein [Lachnospiraceae bacterium]
MMGVQRIWEHPLYQECLLTIERLESNRIFCGHDRTHLLDVARIAYIENLESGAGIPKHLIYAAALLHDIGRHLQYLDGTPHHEASALLAEQILPECGFSSDDTAQILDAIRSHRSRDMRAASGLAGLIYRADKRSRCCFACPAEAECNWDKEKKNMTLAV